ncbi:MAG TPA: hypothetical protein VKB80_08785 [Kofleriaceae bacterium]|nr:hypothetical protein [Kofleriaceae bacterium]
MHRSSRWRTRLFLLSLCAAPSLLAAPRATTAAPPEPCRGDVFKCAEETLGVDLDVEIGEQPEVVVFGTRLVIYWWDGDCKIRQVVIVTVANLPQLQDIMRPLGANEWNALGELSRADYQAALADGTLHLLFAEPPEVEGCKAVNPLPPCELPWGAISIDVIPWPDEEILLMSSLEPVENPEFCFSVDLERGPIIGPVPEVMVPFFFLDAKDVGRVTRLLNRR